MKAGRFRALLRVADGWIERAVLGRLPPLQDRVLTTFLVLGTLVCIAMAVLSPPTASLALLLPVLLGCFFRGMCTAWLLPPMAGLHYALDRTPSATAVFVASGILGITFAIVTLDKYREARRQGEELRHSLEVARQVQRALDPPPHLEWGNLHAAAYLDTSELLGGDVLCLRPVGPDRFGILLGDVMGKGVRAALAAAFVTGLYGELAREGFSPSAILEIANRRIWELFSKFDLFVTLAVLEYDPKGDEWRLALAGHEPPVLVRADGTWEELGERGLVAGIDPNERYPQVRRPALRGDQLFVASDGLLPLDSASPQLASLLGELSARPLPKALAGVVAGLRPLPPERSDDATAVLLRVDSAGFQG